MSKIINIYTDGSTINNGKANASGGYGVYFPDFLSLNLSEPFLLSVPTNQKTELYALLRCFQQCLALLKTEEKYEFHIYSDSDYSIKCLTTWIKSWIKNGWKKADGKPVKNMEIIKPMSEEYNKLLDKAKVVITHINSHTGKQDIHSIGNDTADKLAMIGTQQHPNYKKSFSL